MVKETHEHAVKRGKKSRASGAEFERRARKDLEEKGWIVDKFTNNVSDVYEQDIGEYVRELIPAKAKWNNFTKSMMMGSGGFPDFLAFRYIACNFNGAEYEVIGVECKSDGVLDKTEKEKCEWLLDKKVFSKILIASKHKIKNRIHIEYTDFEIKHRRKK